jgi:hypothetical protein
VLDSDSDTEIDVRNFFKYTLIWFHPLFVAENSNMRKYNNLFKARIT